MAKKYIYHEQQESLLCGQHCLNNLLQGPYFTAVDLASIAEELDAQEQALGINLEEEQRKARAASNEQFMNSFGYITPAALHSTANVDDAGNFSIQVLRTALQRFNNIELLVWFQKGGEEMQKDPSEHQAFIVNRSGHWYAIRQIHNHFWDLNSTKEKPEIISHFYLSAFLSQLREDGYDIFLVKGTIPEKNDPESISEFLPPSPTGTWHTIDELIPEKNKKENIDPFQGKGHRLGGGDEDELQQLAAAGFINDEELEIAKAISMSLQQNNPSSSTGKDVNNTKDDARARRLAALAKRGIS